MSYLIVDADIIAYKAAAGAEFAVNWGEGEWSLHAKECDVEDRIDEAMSRLAENAGLPVLSALSHSKNYRKDVAPYYKANRAKIRRPMLLNYAKEYITAEHNGFSWDNIEADDVLGIMCTEPHGNVIWSEDKDLMTVPGLHLVDGKIIEVTEEEGDKAFFIQTLTGDMTDNYAGCPKVGKITAERHLEKQGYTWEAVVSAYLKAGLSEEVALENARLARILRHGEYDIDTGEVTLWTPTTL